MLKKRFTFLLYKIQNYPLKIKIAADHCILYCACFSGHSDLQFYPGKFL